LLLTREELMRHEAAGITSAAFPKTLRLGGVDCSASYLHSPGDAKDGVTVTVPIYALNQLSEERCEWLVPGMLKDKVLALVKTLHQRPRSRLVPLPDYVDTFIAELPFGSGSLVDALLKHVREKTQVDVKRADFKQEQVPTHLMMNFRVVDEQGRQLGQGRNLAALKAELGGQARSAFQALAGLKVETAAARPQTVAVGGKVSEARSVSRVDAKTDVAPSQSFTAWTFGELPELMEVKKAGQTLIGFPALIDKTTHVEIEVFDEPEVAQRKHRAGLRRLIALQIKDALKYLERNIPDLQKMAVTYLLVGGAGGGPEELRDQIIEVAIDRAFLAEPLPTDAAGFARRIEEGRGRLTLIASEVARSAGAALIELAAALRKLKDARAPKEVTDDITQQLARLVPRRFVASTPWAQLAHLPRYLKAIVMRLEKWRADPARDAQRLAELRPMEQRFWRHLADRKGVADVRLDEFRWLLEELRVSLFAQELRTPQPVSVKRLDKAWAQLST
jgi:ATP-dependent helicase HrpA